MHLDSGRVEKPTLAYSLEEAAVSTGCDVSTLQAAISRNELLARYAANTPIILVDELVDWLKTLPTKPRGGNAPPPPVGDADINGPESLGEKPAVAAGTVEPTTAAVFRTPEEVAPELGMTKTELRRYCKESGHYTKLSMRRIMLDADNIASLIAWMRKQQNVTGKLSTGPDRDYFA